MVQFHTRKQALATLAVKDRQTHRYLLFDDQLQLCGRQNGRDGAPEFVRPAPTITDAGIFRHSHYLPAPLADADGRRRFPIVASYLHLAAVGEKILGFRADEYYWRDLGKPENIIQAELDLRQNAFSL